jgi:hypothetical protein
VEWGRSGVPGRAVQAPSLTPAADSACAGGERYAWLHWQVQAGTHTHRNGLQHRVQRRLAGGAGLGAWGRGWADAWLQQIQQCAGPMLRQHSHHLVLQARARVSHTQGCGYQTSQESKEGRWIRGQVQIGDWRHGNRCTGAAEALRN